jgi:hypothetical protein
MQVVGGVVVEADQDMQDQVQADLVVAVMALVIILAQQ